MASAITAPRAGEGAGSGVATWTKTRTAYVTIKVADDADKVTPADVGWAISKMRTATESAIIKALANGSAVEATDKATVNGVDKGIGD